MITLTGGLNREFLRSHLWLNGINLFNLQHVGILTRRYAGMAASPLPISIRDVDAYLTSCPAMMAQELFEAAIFALEDEYWEEWRRQQDEETEEGTRTDW